MAEDVHAFSGHIACDADTESEIVVPMLVGDRLIGVLDIDSLQKAAFSRDDVRGLEQVAHLIVRSCDFLS